MSKLSYKTLLIIFLSLLIAVVVLWKFVLPKQQIKASWWNDSWNYRQAINISSHTSLESNVYIITSVNIGTTTKAQVDDGDFRFIDQSGQNLDYYITSGVGTTTITFHIQFSSFPAGAQTIYAYYGNPSVANGFSAADFSTQATNYTIGSLSTEEAGGAPIAYWKFDEGVGTTTMDSTINFNTGTFTGTTLPTWASEDQCISGKCLYSTGKGYLNAGNNSSLNINTNSITVETWVKFDFLDYTNNTGKLIGFAGKGHPDIVPGTSSYGWWFSYDNRNNGKTFKYSCFGNSAGGWNGGNNNFSTSSYTFNQNTWYHLAFTIGQNQGKLFINGKQIGPTVTFTGLQLNNSTNNQYLGSIQGGSNMFGFQDDLKIYSYARSAKQILLDYNSRGSSKGTTANLGIKSSTAPDLNSKLIAYYKFDEKNGTTVYDSINKNNTGTITGAVWSPIKSGIGLSFDGSNDYITLSSSPLDNTTVWSITTKLKYINKSKQFEFFLGKNDAGTTGKILLRYNGYISFRGTNGTYYNFSTTSDEINNLDNTLSFVSNGTTIKLYINGLYKSTITPVSTSISLNIIGNAWNDTAWQSVFLLDEVKIYNTALTDDEIKQDCNQKSAIQFGSTNQTIGGTTTSLEYCIPGDTSFCASPVAEWNFEENTGTIAKDTSGNNNNGTFGTGNSAPTWTIGKKNTGAGLKFSGNNYLNTSDFSWANTDSFSISLWIKPNSLPAQGGILGKISPNWEWTLFTTNGVLNFNYYTTAGAYGLNITTGSILSINNWYHVIVTYNGSQGYIYVNGIQQGSASGSGTWQNRATNALIGQSYSPAGNNYFFNGSIDNVRIYNYARTPAQVAYDYNKGGPIAWWKLDECQGLTAFDASGFGNNGTINIGSSGSQTSVGTCQVGTSAAWTNGASGHTNSSLNFDGTDDYLTTTSIPASGSFSISTWFKPGSSITDGQRIYWGNGSNRATLAYSGTVGKLQWYVQTTSGTLGYKVSTNTFKTNDWNHTVLVYDGSSVKLFINGILDPITGSLNGISSASGFNFGTNYNKTANWFNGQIDDIRFYNYALTSEQTKTIYNGGAVNFN